MTIGTVALFVFIAGTLGFNIPNVWEYLKRNHAASEYVVPILPDPLDINIHPEARGYVAYLDGKLCNLAYAASISGGWCDRFVPDHRGQPYIDTTINAPKRERVFGRVELRPIERSVLA